MSQRSIYEEDIKYTVATYRYFCQNVFLGFRPKLTWELGGLFISQKIFGIDLKYNIVASISDVRIFLRNL